MSAKIFGVDGSFINSVKQLTKSIKQVSLAKQNRASFTLLPNIIYTKDNIYQLEQLKQAKNILIIEDEPIEQRDFCDGRAAEIYKEITKQNNVTIFTTNELRQRYIEQQWPFAR